MTVTDKEIRLQRAQVQRDLANGMGTIDHTQDALLPARLGQPLKREPYGGLADDSVKDSHADVQPIGLGLGHHGLEPLDELIVADGELVLDLDGADRGRLAEMDDGVFDSTIDGREVNDYVAFAEHQVPEDGVDARRGVADKDALFRGRLEEPGDGLAGLVQQNGTIPTDEHVGVRFSFVLESAQLILDETGICTKGA